MQIQPRGIVAKLDNIAGNLDELVRRIAPNESTLFPGTKLRIVASGLYYTTTAPRRWTRAC
ncbi:MAG: hypothetical protein WA849_03810 [Candidatus Udaeobacter sp.]